MTPLGSRWHKINHLFSRWHYDDEDYDGPPQDEYDSLLDQVREIVGHSAIVEAAFHYQWVEDFVSGNALRLLPSLKNVTRLKLADCRRKLEDPDVFARLEHALKQFDCLQHLELSTSLSYVDWKSLSLETYLRLNNVVLSPFIDGSSVIGLRKADDGFITFRSDFSCFAEHGKKVVRLRGNEYKPGFVLKLVEAFKSVQRKITVILPRSPEPCALNEPFDLSVLTNANGIEVRRGKSTATTLTMFHAPAVTVLTNDVEYANQCCAGFEEKTQSA